MKLDILTLFPDMFNAMNYSIMGKAIENQLIEMKVHNIRDYSLDRHKKCDDYSFGGGAGMVMMAQPVCDAFRAVDSEHKGLHIYMSPKGKTLNQSLVEQLAKEEYLVILCGHYEGVDERALKKNIDMEISIGDYVLMGGELPAMVLCDAIARYVPKVLHSAESTVEESFTDNLLEYPQYTRPAEFEGEKVPEILLSGHHENIAKWRMNERLRITKELRPDLLTAKGKNNEKK